MEHKHKSGKRFLSGVLSAAMLANFCTVMPITAFADDDIDAEVQTTDSNGHRYQLFDTSMSWTDAESYCESIGGHLVTITSAEEQQYIIENLLPTGTKNTYFIGLSRDTDTAEWSWVTSEPFYYTNWDYGEPNSTTENYVHMYANMGNVGTWNNTYNFLEGNWAYATANCGFICEWEENEAVQPSYNISPYVLFSGSNSSDFTLNCWKSTSNGDVYTGRNFISNASELYLNGNVDAVDSITAYGWKVNIEERNEHIEKEEMPDWDSRIIATAGDYETSDEDVVRIEDKNVIDGALKTSGNVIISGTVFDGNCYIIADGNITYNVNDFKSSGRVVLYSRNGNITINGSNIDVNGILYAPNGTVSFNSNISNINGRIFADKINFSGSVFNVNGSDSDWELLGRKAVISKTYTFNEDFNEGEFDGLGLDVADELTLEQRTDSVSSPSENEYKDNDSVNGIALNVKTDKSVLTNDGETVNVEFDLNGFGSQEIEENHVDLAIVVDTSGSMSGTRRNNAVRAAKEVVSKMKLGDRCAIINFTTSANVIQGFTDDAELLNTAIDKLNANGGTNIANGINGAVELFDETGSASRQKYIILMSDGEDSSASAQAATDASGKRITICALAIGSNSSQMETIANNTKGYYKNSPTAEQIGEMMNMFADVVFNNAGTDVSFTATLNRNANADIDNMTPTPAEIIENENGTKTLKWTFDKLTIDQSEKIKLPVSVNGVGSGLNNIISDVSCTYYNRAGVSNTVYADDLILPSHIYKQEGSWTTVYDSKTAGTEWKNIYWNGKLYDDSVLSVMAQTGDDLDAFGEWTEITNHKDITDLKGRYIRVKVNMAVSSSGKTPELYDITLLSDGADKVNHVNNAPIVSVSGNTTTRVSKKITLISTAEDDAFNSKLSFNWNCDSKNVQIFGSNKPYASFKFNESGTYDITLSVSDDSSTSVITKTITVLNDDVLVKPMIDIDVPSVVKSGATINGSISNLNDAEIAEYEVLVGGNTVNVSSNGQFSFTAPDSDTIIAVEAKAFNIVGVSGSADTSIIVDATAPTAQLKADKDEVNVNEAVTITAFVDDENGISNYSLTLGGEAVSLDSNYQFSFVPTAIGSYAFELNVTDMAGNTSSASLTINVAEGKAQPVVNYSIPRVIMLGETGDFRFVSDSDVVVTVKVNGEAVQLDADGKFSYTPDVVGNLTIDIHATNGGNTDTDFTLTVPVVKVELISDKTAYTDEELITVKLVYSDNLTITSQTATIDNIPYTISDDTIQADRLDAGSHEVVWYAEDGNGNIYTGTMALAVQDITPPEIEVVLSENALKQGDSVDASIFATDRYGIDSVSATFDGASIAVSGNKVELANLTAGTHVLAVTATDNNGISSTYNYEFTVSAGDTTPPELEVSVSVGENRRIEITASATDDSGNAEITGTVNGKKLTLNDGTAYYDPDDYGTFEIVIRAEDAAGNYTEKTQTVTISEQIKEYELKLSVGLDKNPIKPNETANITVRTNTLLEDVTINCTNDGGSLTQTENGYAFVSDKEGTFKIVVTAADESGNSVSETLYITVSKEQQVIDDHEGEGEYENTYTPEPRARVVLNSNEKTETKMTKEMADLADHLKTPLAVYEYLYNNVNVEFYTGSRKGAIGTYEQNGGNDVDCASLLIAMLRYLGYDAEYITGNVGYTAQQIIDLTAADDIETALKIFMLGNKAVSKSADTYYFDHTWVRATIDGKEYDLDISFKKYKQIESIADEIDKQKINVDSNVLSSPVNAYLYLSEFNDSNESISVNVTGKKIAQRKISILPQANSYIVGEIEEIEYNIIESEIIVTDGIYLGFNGKYQGITAPRATISTISIGYVPNDTMYEEFGDGSKPNSIYNLAGDFLGTYATAISPALYIDNENLYEWDSALTKLGELQTLSIVIKSNGGIYKETKELIVGSVNAIVTDTQAISGQALYTAYEALPLTDDEKAKVNENTVFKDEYIGNLLSLIGNTYFMQLDLENKILAGASEVYIDRTFSYGIFTYNPNVTTQYSQVQIEKNGSYGVDILGNIYSTTSYNGDIDVERDYQLASGYISSYLESLVLEQYLGVYSISTAKIFELASAKGMDFKVFASQNENEVDSLEISNESKAEIHEAISKGQKIIIPAENISVGSWSGTGYIIMGDDEYSFMISNGSHGGYTVTDLSVYYSINVVIAGDAMFHVLYGMISASVTMFMTGNFIGGAVMLGISITLTYILMDFICDCTDIYFDALDGNEAAANQLNLNAFISTAGFLSQPLVEPLAEGLASVKAPECVSNAVNAGNDWILGNSETYRRFVMMGYSDELVAGLFQDARCFLYGDDFIENVLKSGDAHGIMSTLANCPDEIISVVSSSTMKDALPSFISNYGDDGARLLCCCGDDVVILSQKCGGDVITSVAKLESSTANRFVQTLTEQSDEFLNYLKSCDSSFIDDIVSSYEADMMKLESWTYKPNYDLYIRNKAVYDNSIYFEQSTGTTLYPPQDGFANATIPNPTIVPEGTIFKRYGNSNGAFLGGATDSFEARALPPYTDLDNFHYYRLNSDYEFTVGEIESWFGQTGGGTQYVSYYPDPNGEIIINGINYSRYSVDELIKAGVLEDITDLVLEGEIIIE